MDDLEAFGDVPTTTLADVLGGSQAMDFGMRPLWEGMPRFAGPAFTVRCPPGDNLMLHAAVHRAAPGSVLVVAGCGVESAVAGGNVCAVAQRRGIAALVVDGVIRDLAEVREARFPVVARGVVPVAGVKAAVLPLGERVRCGGVDVEAGDVVVADEEGVVVTPRARAGEVLVQAQARLRKEAGQTLEEWEREHRARIDRLLAENGRTD
ncbi:RraA family protein [Streptomyces sp. NPDC059740]|uniref:RraA family protein n=1 Tax=Streptomyces sp. NPDC059740 TaxID=3346926 RepID=UPI003664741A